MDLFDIVDSNYDLTPLERIDSHTSNTGGFPESTVLIIATGGTICMKKSENGYIPARGFLETSLAPRPSFNDHSPEKRVKVAVLSGEDEETVSYEYHRTLRTPVSGYNRHVRFAVLEFDPLLDSSSINAKGWSKIVKVIEKNYTLFDAFVILHGTDSLAYTCSAVSFMLQNLGKSVIFTGSQAPMSELRTDATDNLLGSLIVAGHFMIAEVCLFFNNRLFRGNRTTKISANDFNAFNSPNHPPLGKVGINIKIHWNLIKRPEIMAPFSIQSHFPDTSHVACLRIFPGIQPQMIESVLKMNGLKGLVLETFGSGNAPEDDELLRVLREGVERDIIIVAVTQCMIGSVNPLYAAGTALLKTGVVFGLDMTTEAALTKLSCLLADPNLTPEEIRRTMAISTRGELTESANTSFSHPESLVIPPKYSTLNKIIYAVSSNDYPATVEILNISKEFLLNEFDHTGNTPIHIAASAPNSEFLRLFLSLGGSVHLRNREGKTPLFIAAETGLIENVRVLREAGGHLHEDEKVVARGIRRICEHGEQLGIDSLKDIHDDGLEAWLGGGSLQKARPYGGSPGRISPGVKVRAECWEAAGAEA